MGQIKQSKHLYIKQLCSWDVPLTKEEGFLDLKKNVKGTPIVYCIITFPYCDYQFMSKGVSLYVLEL